MNDVQRAILAKLQQYIKCQPTAQNIRTFLGNPYGFYPALRGLLDSGLVETFETQRRTGQCVVCIRVTNTDARDRHLQNR